MVMKDNKQVQGAEGIILHNNSIVLGMQKLKRWYTLSNGKRAAIIKTLGGQIEDVDENSTRRALLREMMEEMEGLKTQDIMVSINPIFSKKVQMGKMNPYEPESNLSMQADFYVAKIREGLPVLPNDLPALLEIPISEFIGLQFSENQKIDSLQKFLVINENMDFNLPEYYAFMIPEEVREFLKRIKVIEERKGDEER